MGHPSSGLERVLSAVATTAARLCEARDCQIYLAEGSQLRFAAQHGPRRPVSYPGYRVGETRPINRRTALGAAILDRRTVHVRDMKAATRRFPESPAAQRIPGVSNTRTLLAAPLLRDGQVVGGITIRRTAVRPFTPRQISLLETFAGQAALAIDNARLSEELGERNRALGEALKQQTATSDVLRIISSSPTDLQPVLDVIAERAVRLCDGMFGSVYRFDGELIHMVAHHNYPAVALELSRQRFPTPPTRGLFTARAILERAVVHVPDVEHAADYTAHDLVAAAGFRSVLSVPMLRDGKPVGAITVWRAASGPFPDRQVALLQTFADQAVIAIENARLFSELRERNRDLTQALERETATGDILRVISSSPTDLQPVLNAVAKSAARLCAAYDAIILRLDGDVLRRVAHHGPIPAPPAPVFAPTRDTVGGRTVLDRQPIHVADLPAETGEFPVGSAVARQLGSRTVLGVPLLREGVAIGAIYLRRTEVRPFTDSQITLLQTFADQAVIAIENVRLFTELQQRNSELSEALERQTATSEILQVISSSPTDTRPVFDTIVRNAVTLCGALYGMVWRYDGDLVQLVGHHDLPPEELDELRRVFPRPAAGMAFHEDLRRGVVKNVRDVETASEVPAEVRARSRRRGVRSVLVAPMRRGDEVIGAIGVSHREIGAFSPSREELLKTFADQAVIAIENVRLFTELQARNRDLSEALEQQTATSEILRVISSSPTDIQPVFATLATSAARLCDAFDAAIHRIDGDVLRLVAHEGPIEPDAVLPLRQGTVAGHAVREQRTLQVADLQAEEDAYPLSARFARNRGFRTILAVPMLRGAEALGTITIRRTEVRPFTDRQAELLKTFADQAVIAIENVRLFNELQARNGELTEALEQQTATSEILRVISQSQTDVQPVFDTIVESAARLCDGTFSVLLGFDGEMIRLVATHNWTPAALDIARRIWPAPPSRELVTNRAILERAVIHVPDVELEYRADEPRELVRMIGYRSVLAVPMLRDGVPLGVIAVGRAESGLFADNQIALLKTFADQAVIAIENVRLFTELQARNRELTVALEQQTATSEVLRVISRSQTDAQPVFDTIAQSAVRLCEGVQGTVVRLDGALVHRLASFNMDPEGEEAFRRYFPRPADRRLAVTRAALEGSIVHIPDVLQDPDMDRETQLRTVARAVLAVPMLRNGQSIGAIAVVRREPRLFSDDQVALLKTFADQAVIAIENVRLFTELQARTRDLTRSVEQLTALGEVSRALSSTLDLDVVLGTIVARARQLAGIDACTVHEYDERVEEFHLRATHNLNEEVVAVLRRAPIRKGEGAAGRMAVTREPVHIADITAAGAYHGPLREVLLRSGARAVLTIPLLREGHLIGGLTVTRMRPGEFQPETIELLKTFATQSALAIQNARLFREIADKSRELEVASRHKSQFLANMSHELRTPLNAILGYTELIADNIYGEVPERMREVLERVDKSGRHLLGLINDVLDLSKIEAGQLTLALTDYSLADVVHTVAASVGSLAAEKKLELAITVDPDLPLGRGDARRLTQVLLNLVGNALKFTEAGRVAVEARRDGESFLVSVTDTGPGIAPGDQERVFEEFQQVQSSKAGTKGGTGLGLAIARRIVHMHGGRLWLDSTLGEGSTFSFTVPVRVE